MEDGTHLPLYAVVLTGGDLSHCRQKGRRLETFLAGMEWGRPRGAPHNLPAPGHTHHKEFLLPRMSAMLWLKCPALG